MPRVRRRQERLPLVPNPAQRSLDVSHFHAPTEPAPARRTGIWISLSESDESSAVARSSILSISSSPRAGRGLDDPPSPAGVDRGTFSRSAFPSTPAWPPFIFRLGVALR